jgi:hypothetical protein
MHAFALDRTLEPLPIPFSTDVLLGRIAVELGHDTVHPARLPESHAYPRATTPIVSR